MILREVVNGDSTIRLEREEERNARGRTISATLRISINDETEWEGPDTQDSADQWQTEWDRLTMPKAKRTRSKKAKG